jgi:SAM-dependent methyltransferase
MSELRDAREPAYAERLARLEGAAWKRWLRVQAPYRWNLRRLRLGRTLEIGCGIGRNLEHLGAAAVGIDPNPDAVAAARRRGCAAYLPGAFRDSPEAARLFDALLFAHVLEHVSPSEARALLADHLGFLRPRGRVALICPQEAGYRTDPTHVTFLDFAALGALLDACGLGLERAYSFPLPRAFGRWFPHNEFVVVGRRP